ncbi:reverse transcriptase domain-containing protein [Tanacetum coccineum]
MPINSNTTLTCHLATFHLLTDRTIDQTTSDEALAAQDANRNVEWKWEWKRNDSGSHDSEVADRRTHTTARDCGALTWWNSHVTIVCHDAAYGMPWKTLMKMMTENYYPRSKIKKLETELWNLVVKGTDVESYTQCFHELILLCSRMVSDESDKVEKYTGGLPDSI